MEGRLTLMKSVIKVISVYWMSLISIPKTVLNKIRRMFKFMWVDNKEKKCIHLIHWKALAIPKRFRG